MIHNKKEAILLMPMKCATGTIFQILYNLGFVKFNQHHAVPAVIIDQFVTPNQFKNLFKILPVRNPYDRLVSFYEFISIIYEEKGEVCYKNFDDFLLSHNYDDVNKNGGFLPMHRYYYLNNKPIKFGSIIRFETLESDIYKMLRKLGVEEMPHIPVVHKTNDHKPFQEYFVGRQDRIDIAYDKYKEDFELFGYSKEIVE